MSTTANAKFVAEARERFEALVPQVINQEITDQCVAALNEIRQHGGHVSDADWQAVFPHLQTVDARVRAMMVSMLRVGMTSGVEQ